MKIPKWINNFLDPVRTGTLEKIDLTFGGAGNQVMTIDGLDYATWIDYKKWPAIGSTVSYTIYTEYDGSGNKLRCAHLLLTEQPETKGVQ